MIGAELFLQVVHPLFWVTGRRSSFLASFVSPYTMLPEVRPLEAFRSSLTNSYLLICFWMGILVVEFINSTSLERTFTAALLLLWNLIIPCDKQGFNTIFVWTGMFRQQFASSISFAACHHFMNFCPNRRTIFGGFSSVAAPGVKED